MADAGFGIFIPMCLVGCFEVSAYSLKSYFVADSGE
jgi:hypothetical protein